MEVRAFLSEKKLSIKEKFGVEIPKLISITESNSKLM
jgi:hypothetical protein